MAKREKEEESSRSSSDSSDHEETMPVDEAPAMSHAQRRKLKRKRGDDDEKAQDDAPTDKAPKSEGKKKHANSVWVGNLHFKVTADDLRKFFESAGEITRVNMPTKASDRPGPDKKQNKGFAYVDFATKEAHAAAIALSEKPLMGRRLLIKDDKNWEGSKSVTAMLRPDGKPFSLTKTSKKILQSQKQNAAPVLFMGNLPFKATEEDIRSLLESNTQDDHKEGKRAKKSEDGDKMEGDEDEKDDDEEPAVLTFETPVAVEDLPPLSDKKDKKKKKAKEPKPIEKIDIGLRRIRLGTFEDTGDCKGWAFLDFTSTPHATAALIHPGNHMLFSRKIVLEYASPVAVRRGGYNEDGTLFQAPPKKKSRPMKSERGFEKQAKYGPPAEEVVEPSPADGKPARFRPKPGSALAMAKRESLAIVPGEGKKIVF